jgi:hypothetical protein
MLIEVLLAAFNPAWRHLEPPVEAIHIQISRSSILLLSKQFYEVFYVEKREKDR